MEEKRFFGVKVFGSILGGTLGSRTGVRWGDVVTVPFVMVDWDRSCLSDILTTFLLSLLRKLSRCIVTVSSRLPLLH